MNKINLQKYLIFYLLPATMHIKSMNIELEEYERLKWLDYHRKREKQAVTKKFNEVSNQQAGHKNYFCCSRNTIFSSLCITNVNETKDNTIFHSLTKCNKNVI